MKRKTSLALSEEALEILAKLARRYGVSRTAMLELIIREKEKAELGTSNDTHNIRP